MTEKFEVQTRTEDGDLNYFPTVNQAFEYAVNHPSVWKVSFPIPDGSRARFVRDGSKTWRYEQILEGL